MQYGLRWRLTSRKMQRNQMKLDVKNQLKEFADKHIDDEVVYKVHVAEGKTYATILDYAEKLGADLIVMPSHKRSKIDKVDFGSVASKAGQNSPINVLVVKPQG
ncbi:universal stress protein [Vibrio chagasii]|nr:universal stress protein [Vibrio chagasii]